MKTLNVSPGDIVRVVAPAGRGAVDRGPEIQNYIQSLGLVANITENIYNRTEPFYSNWDDFRADDLISALLDDSVKIIWCTRGGSGSIRLIPYLEQRLPATLNHKIFIGYSDITVLHLYLQKKYGWQTIHGAMLDAIVGGTYNGSRESVDLLTGLIFEREESICYPALTSLNENAPQRIESTIVGGNACLLETSIGTLWQIDAKGKVLFLEDVSEAPYSIERSLDHMKQSGIFNLVDGVIFGDFTDTNDTLMDIVFNRFAQSVTFPVFRISGIGHDTINYPLPLAASTQITRIDSNSYSFCVDNIQNVSNGSCNNHSRNIFVRLSIVISGLWLILKIN